MRTKLFTGGLLALIVLALLPSARGFFTQGYADIHMAFPSVSPDGRQLLAWSPAADRSAIQGLLMDLDGSNQRPSPVPRGASWLPDSRRVLTVQGRNRSSPGHLVIMGVDGSDPQDLPTGGIGVGLAQATRSNTVVFGNMTRDEATRIGLWRWYAMNLDGSNLSPLNFAVPATETVFLSVAASNDGRRVAFTAIDFSQANDPAREHRSYLYVMNLDGSGLRKLATLQEDAGGLAWSPDDQEIALTDSFTPHPVPANFIPRANIVVVSLTSGSLRRLSRQDRPHLDEHPSWSPDGRIFFQSNRDGRMEIYRMKADGSEQTRVTR